MELRFKSLESPIWSGQTNIIEVRGEQERHVFSVELAKFKNKSEYLNFIDFLLISLNENTKK